MTRMQRWWFVGASAVLLAACKEVVPPPATQLSFIVQPSNATAGLAISPAIAVAIEDASGRTVTSASGAVTVALAANPGGGTLSGTTTVNAVHGVATFRDLSIRPANSGYTLSASSATLQGATSALFDIALAPPTRLAFSIQPGNATAGAMITPPVQVSIQDAFGTTVTSATDAVTLALGTNPGGATLAGTRTANAVNGVATFSNLSIQKAATGYTLTASAVKLAAATSAPFVIAPAAPATASFLVPPGATYVAQPIAPAVRVAIQDAFANTVTSATNPVTLALGANPGGATLGGTLTAPAVNGVASFANLSLDQPGTGYTLAATSGTLTGATSPPFTVNKLQLIAFVMEDQTGTHRGIATMHGDGSSVVSLTASGEAPVWSPDGTKIAFLAGHDVFVMNADGTGVVDILPGDAATTVAGLAWKPDGSRLAFAGAYNYASGLFLMAPDGSNVTRILPGPSYGLGHPSWSPAGSRLVLECPLTGTAHLCIVNADGTGLVQLTSGFQPAWKPDGTRIVFVDGSGLKLINPDGSGVTPLLSYGGALLPAWSADGQRIAFVAVAQPPPCSGSSSSSYCPPAPPDTIVVANADGTGLHAVKPAGSEPAWRP